MDHDPEEAPIEVVPDADDIHRVERGKAAWRAAWIVHSVAVVAGVVTYQLVKRASWEQEMQIAAVGYTAAGIFWAWPFFLTLRAARFRKPSDAFGMIWVLEVFVVGTYVWPWLLIPF